MTKFIRNKLFYICYNHFHIILRLFDGLPIFTFTTSEAMRDYYLKTWYMRLTSLVAERPKTFITTFTASWHFRRWGGLCTHTIKKKKNLHHFNPMAFLPMGGLSAHTRKKTHHHGRLAAGGAYY